MKTVTLYRPVGLKEYELILALESRRFPPRLSWQPIFYPVLNQPYAEQIAGEWNTQDAFSGYCGIVTRFQLDEGHFRMYEVQNVGADLHNELWVPAERLEVFNDHIMGPIAVVKVFRGAQFTEPENGAVAAALQKHQ
jgi:hypothetical protein